MMNDERAEGISSISDKDILTNLVMTKIKQGMKEHLDKVDKEVRIIAKRIGDSQR